MFRLMDEVEESKGAPSAIVDNSRTTHGPCPDPHDKYK